MCKNPPDIHFVSINDLRLRYKNGEDDEQTELKSTVELPVITTPDNTRYETRELPLVHHTSNTAQHLLPPEGLEIPHDRINENSQVTPSGEFLSSLSMPSLEQVPQDCPFTTTAPIQQVSQVDHIGLLVQEILTNLEDDSSSHSHRKQNEPHIDSSEKLASTARTFNRPLKENLWKTLLSLKENAESQEFLETITREILRSMNQSQSHDNAEEVLQSSLKERVELLHQHAMELLLDNKIQKGKSLLALCLQVQPNHKILQRNIKLLERLSQ